MRDLDQSLFAIKEALAKVGALNRSQAVVEFDPDGRVVWANQRFLDLMGYELQDIVGKPHRIFVDALDFDPAAYAEFWRRLRAGEFHSSEFRRIGQYGKEVWIQGTYNPLFDDHGRVYKIVKFATDVTDHKRDELAIRKSRQALDYLAHHDQLTGLPNRTSLLHSLSHELSTGGSGAVLFLDLDRFKTVNDGLGHAAGDELLRVLAARLRSRLSASDIIARFGGDEFVIVAKNASTADSARVVADMAIRACSEPVSLGLGGDVSVGASVGIALYAGTGVDAETLLRNADAALYAAKADGKGCHRLYDAVLTEDATRRLLLEASISRALAMGEFYIEYQPLLCLSTGAIRGAEALTRWLDPARGVVCPDEFIPTAEVTGQIVPLGAWVLRSACAQMLEWLKRGFPLETMAVNVSARELKTKSFAASVAEILAQTGLPPEHLELEISESTFIEAGSAAQATMKALKALGVKLSIDDFGTGYSSLAYLKNFEVDKIKMDRSFISDIGDSASRQIASAILQLGRSLKLEVLAEGVETDDQRHFLLQNNCDSAQGFLFSKPISPELFTNLLSVPRLSTRVA